MIQNCRPPRHQDSIENIPEKDLVYSDYISIFDVPDEELFDFLQQHSILRISRHDRTPGNLLPSGVFKPV